MRNVHTAPMEVFAQIGNGPYALEPYEVGWAAEALLFVYIREVHGRSPSLSFTVQISVDGNRWIDTPHTLGPLTEAGGSSLLVTGFGNWLRLAGEASGGPEDGSAAFVADFYWVLKD